MRALLRRSDAFQKTSLQEPAIGPGLTCCAGSFGAGANAKIAGLLKLHLNLRASLLRVERRAHAARSGVSTIAARLAKLIPSLGQEALMKTNAGMLTVLGVVALVLMGAGRDGARAAAQKKYDASRWWSYVEFLASDKLEGRLTGSEGHRKPAEFVADHFKNDGLLPAGEAGHGYMQPVAFKVLTIDEGGSSLALVQGGSEHALRLGEDASISMRVDPAPMVDAGLVFVGYGLHAPEVGYDDLAGVDVKGQIAVFIAGAPDSMSSTVAAHYQSGDERWKSFKAAGIVGAISIANPNHMDIPWARSTLSRFNPTMKLAVPGMDPTEGIQLAVTWNPAHADELLEGTGHAFADLVATAESRKALPHFAIPAQLKAKTAVKRSTVESQNIAAIYPGTDPKLKDEYVVMSAHIDHLGVGQPIHGDAIYNGAMDNAAGTASVLEEADHLKEAHVRTKRSILLVAVTGEEEGDLGSEYFASHPTVRQKAMVADINTDMYLPLYPLRILTVYGVDESTLGDDARAVAENMDVRVQGDPEPARNVFIRSDQYSFVMEGVPAVMLSFGNEKGSKEAAIEKAWLTNRYHAPSDDLGQPVNEDAAAKFNVLTEEMIERVANAEEKPQWKASSFFRRYAK
jgi:Zn-dependent M28 family amino/carboxypeptidase